MYPKHSHIFLKEGEWQGNAGEGWGKVAEELSFPFLWLLSVWLIRGTGQGASPVEMLCRCVPLRGHTQGPWKEKGPAPHLSTHRQTDASGGYTVSRLCAGLSEALKRFRI